MTDVRQARVAILATNGFEQSELQTPQRKLKEAGATVVVVAPQSGQIRGWQHQDWGDNVTVDLTLDRADPGDFDAIVLPGGRINPDLLRIDAQALKFIKAFLDAGKVVAAICHAPWLLVELDAVRGRQVTSYKSISTDVKNAGGFWLDQAVVMDGSLVTSRNPGDLDAFSAKIIEAIGEGRRKAAG